MPITEACRIALAENRKVQPTIVHPQNDLGYYDAIMLRADVPVSVSPTVEVQWIAFKLPLPNETPEALRAIWHDAPSKVAATWLRQLRLKADLQKKFWGETFPAYMSLRLGLELRADAPKPLSPSRKKGSAGGDPSGDIERLLKKGEGA